MLTVVLRTIAQNEMAAWRTKSLAVSLVGIASPIITLRGESEMLRKTGIVIVTGNVVVTDK